MARHRFTKNKCGQKMNTGLEEKSPPQVRNENKSSGQLATSPQHIYRVFVTEMMKRKRAQRDVVCFHGIPFENIRFAIVNFRIATAQFPGNLQCRRLSIEGVDLDLRANSASVIRYQSRNVAGPGGKIDNTGASVRLDPAAHEIQNKTMAAEPAVKLPKAFQIALQLSRNRLRPIHHFQYGRIEASLHSGKN